MKPAAEPGPVAPGSADKLRNELEWTPENMLRIARAFLEDPQYGDVPEAVVHGFQMSLDSLVGPKVLEQIEALRRAHFARLGKPVPEYAGEFVR